MTIAEEERKMESHRGNNPFTLDFGREPMEMTGVLQSPRV